MDNACKRATHRHVADSSLLALSLLMLPAASHAADAHKSVQARHGELVVLRNVAARPADRQSPPGMALIVDLSPRHELSQALGTDELSDAEYASLGATPKGGATPRGTTVERMVSGTLGGSPGSSTGSRDNAASNGFSSMVTAPTGVVGATTGNIGNELQGALSQLPGLPPSPAGGH